MSDSAQRKATAPYPAWKTFRRFIGKIVAKGMPSRIDHTVMAGMSGSARSTIRRALVFLELTDEHGVPTAKLRGLAPTLDSDEWKPTLRPIIMDAYAPILEGLDMEMGTAQQLAECFRSRGNVSGNTLTMAVRFFLGALDEAGVGRSPYFAAPPRPAKRNNSAKASDHTAGESSKSDESEKHRTTITDDMGHLEQPASAWPSQPFLLPTRQDPIILRAPQDLTLAEWSLIDVFVRGRIELTGRKVPPPAGDAVDGG